MSKVSVIIPVYNVEPYLARCLDSVCNQTLKDIEIICINDCSTDNSLAILKDYASKDNRIKIIDFEENKNAAVARNAGLKIAKGEYLGFVDADDYIDLNFYEELYNKAIEDNADTAKCERLRIEPDGSKVESKLNADIKKAEYKYLFTTEWQSLIYRANFIKDNAIILPEECPKGQDSVFLNRCLLKANKLTIVDNVHYYYMRREGSLHADKLSHKHFISALKVIDLMLEDMTNAITYFKNEDDYIRNFEQHLCIYFSLLFRSDDKDRYNLCANAMINSFKKCKNIEKLSAKFKYKFLLPYLESNNVNALAKELESYESDKQFLLKALRLSTKRKK